MVMRSPSIQAKAKRLPAAENAPVGWGQPRAHGAPPGPGLGGGRWGALRW